MFLELKRFISPYFTATYLEMKKAEALVRVSAFVTRGDVIRVPWN